MKYHVRLKDNLTPSYIYREVENDQIDILYQHSRTWGTSWSYDLKNKSTAVSIEAIIENPQWFYPEYYKLILEVLI